VNAIAFVIYVALGIVVLAFVPGAVLIVREALRRRHAERAFERLSAARRELDRLRTEPPSRVALRLSRRFDPRTIQAALELSLDEEAESVKVCEELGLRASWERTLREGRGWSERAHAARMLGKLGVASAGPALASVLVDPHEDTTVRIAAAEAIGSIVDEAVLPHLCEALASQGEGGAKVVAEALVSFGASAVIPLTNMLRHERAMARTWAARVLGRIGDPAATPALLGRLDDGDAATRAAAAEALGQIRDLRATRPLACAALGDPSGAVRSRAAAALSRVGDEEAVSTLVAALGDGDPEVRSRAIDALGALRPKDRSAIERALFDPVAEVRRSAALALDRLGAVSAWAAALGDPAPEARAAARSALVGVGRAGLWDAVLSAARREDEAVRARVDGVVAEVGPRALDVGAGESRWAVAARRAPTVAERMLAIVELSAIQGPTSTAALGEVLVSDPSPEARAAAARGLARAEERWLAVPALVRALSDPSPDVVVMASRALGGAGSGEDRRRSAEAPVDRNGASRRTTGRMRREEVRESVV